MKILSGKRIGRVLEQRGWTLARINGNHHFFLIHSVLPLQGEPAL